MPELSGAQLTFFAILVGAFALLLTERLRNDLVAVLVVLALAATGLLSPTQAVAGFSSEPALVVVAIFVMGGALHQTGVSQTVGRWIGRLAGGTLARANAVIMVAVAALSAFTHHVTTTAVMLPVTMNLARDKQLPPSQLLMPLSFAASLGTTITIIGAPAFLIASDVLRQAGRPGLGVFSIAPIGVALSLAGALFVVLVGRWLLPARAGAGESGEQRFRLDEYFTELTILEDSPFRDRTIDEVQRDERYPMQVVGLVRAGRQLPRPRADERVRAADVLLVRTSPEQLVALREDRGVELHPVAQYRTNGGAERDERDTVERFVQAVVSPAADFAGRSIAEIDFNRRYGAVVVGLWRRDGWLQQELSKIRLRAGDVLVLHGDDEELSRIAADPNFLLMVPFHAEPRAHGKALLAAAIMVATVIAATLHVPLHLAGLGGAAAMVLTGCIRPAQAYRAIDSRIYVFIAGAIPLGVAMKESGSADVLAGWLESAVGDWSPTLVLLAVFAVVAVLTQFMSDAATTALFAPVAVALADGLGHPPEAYVVTVAMAAVASFLTPIGHHGNLLIYGPGGYRFADFVRVGTPLTVIVAIIVVVLARVLWPS
ncbi:MAG TPA: SLC13 family permease [Terriglobales bacterium]|nr:SLC13 family permease [Terriglobales bacterium]